MLPSHAFRSPYALAAMATVLLLDAGEAQASGNTIGVIATKITSQVGNVGKLAVAGAFLIGVIMVAGGLMKLKQSSENQGQNPPYSAGLWRLALGAGLVALPALTGVLTTSAELGATPSMSAGGGVTF